MHWRFDRLRSITSVQSGSAATSAATDSIPSDHAPDPDGREARGHVAMVMASVAG
jgi:hypothetical protein